MKNLALTIVLIFPLLVTAILIATTLKIDSKLEFVKANPVSYGNLKEKLTIDKHASKRRVYFYLDHTEKTRYERNYRGFVTNWFVPARFAQLENSNTLKFYRDISYNNSEDEKISFFSLNNSHKNFTYYFDIFQFVKEKFFFYSSPDIYNLYFLRRMVN